MVMTVKICANNILYWGTECLIFFHDKYTDLEFMAAVRPDLERIWAITRQLEKMYREWNVLENREWRRAIVPTAAFPGMYQRHLDMAADFDDEGAEGEDRLDRGPDGGIRRGRFPPGPPRTSVAPHPTRTRRSIRTQ